MQMVVKKDSQDVFNNDFSCSVGTDNDSLKTDSLDIFNDDDLLYIIHDDDLSFWSGANNNASYSYFPIQEWPNIDFPFDPYEDTIFHHFPFKVDTISVADQLPRIGDSENLELSQFMEHSNDTRSEPVNIPIPKKARSKRSRPRSQAWTTLMGQGQKRKSKTKGGLKCSHREVQKSLKWRIRPLGPNTLSKTPVGQGRKIKSKTKVGPIFGKCSHCEVQKSPQWRIGPLGPNTLCNACGIRFRSGRLFPEYRPACSPVFSQEMHSNSTRKVLEMRRDREMTLCN